MKRLLLIVVVILVLTGCDRVSTSAPNPETTPEPSASLEPSASHGPTASLGPTATLEPTASVPVPSPTGLTPNQLEYFYTYFKQFMLDGNAAGLASLCDFPVEEYCKGSGCPYQRNQFIESYKERFKKWQVVSYKMVNGKAEKLSGDKYGLEITSAVTLVKKNKTDNVEGTPVTGNVTIWLYFPGSSWRLGKIFVEDNALLLRD